MKPSESEAVAERAILAGAVADVGEAEKETVGGWFTGNVPLCLVAVQLTFVPPLEPEHCHVVELPWAGFVGDVGLDVPAAQYAPLGNASVAV